MPQSSLGAPTNWCGPCSSYEELLCGAGDPPEPDTRRVYHFQAEDGSEDYSSEADFEQTLLLYLDLGSFTITSVVADD